MIHLHAPMLQNGHALENVSMHEIPQHQVRLSIDSCVISPDAMDSLSDHCLNESTLFYPSKTAFGTIPMLFWMYYVHLNLVAPSRAVVYRV